MSIQKKTRKNLLIALVTTVLVAGMAVGLWFFIRYQADQKTVDVLPVMNVTTSYWGDTAYSSGMASSESLQEIYPSDQQNVSEIFVTEGQEVSIGDPLVQYDKTLLELDVEAKDIAVKQAQLQLDKAEEELEKLKNTTPTATPQPGDPGIVIPGDPELPSPTPEPSPSVPPADVPVYSQLEADSQPYLGSGTSEDPYVFLCTDDCVMTQGFLQRLLGEEGDFFSFPEEDLLPSPFAAIFEVREGDSNYGRLLYSFLLDGTQLSANFHVSDVLTGSNTLESIAKEFLEGEATPTPEPDSSNDMAYTAEELKDLIEDKEREIEELQIQVKQAQLDLQKSKISLENSTVLSTINGVVRTLTDVTSAAQSGQPFLVVSGQGQFTIQGTISENYLTNIHVGDTVSAMSYENGMSYSAVITEISTYPLDTQSGMWSTYEFTAAVENPDGLANGMYLDITLNISGQASSDAMYLYKPYFREDEAGSYVMKAGPDNRLQKQYLQLGAAIYGGEYYEIISGLTMEDYIAFPYGNDVKEGVRVVVEGTKEPPYSTNDASAQEDSAGNSDIQTMY